LRSAENRPMLALARFQHVSQAANAVGVIIIPEVRP
jgi:hypothetical protein